MIVASDAVLTAAHSARMLIANPLVAQTWDQPSALAVSTVGGLAAHLGGQVLMVAKALTSEPSDLPVVSALDHYDRATWVDADLDAEINVAIRDGGETVATGGHAALLAAVDDAVATLTALLPRAATDRALPTPAGPWSLPLPEALLTRLMEIPVHSDDLAVSVGLPTPDLPDAVIQPVLGLLATLAARRHGQPAVLRALTRAERATRPITAFGPTAT